jgi:hypothetical protein
VILDSETSQFIERFLSRVNSQHLFEKATKEAKQNKEKWKERWDTPARRIFGPVFREVFRESFPNESDKVSVYVEGEGIPESWKKPPNLFGSAGTYPDLAIIKPHKIAIELDHSEKGLALKMALAKAAFNVLSGWWEYRFVLFYNKNRKLSLDGEKEANIIRIYEEQFHTRIILFP